MTRIVPIDTMINQRIPRMQQYIAVLWPSFIMAGVATVVFFTAFDPAVILADKPWGHISRTGAYTIGFFLFWMLTASSCLLTCYFQRPCAPGATRRKGEGPEKPSSAGS